MQKFSAFAWKTKHKGHEIGCFWEHTRVRDKFMPCGQCDMPEESMPHILFECKASGPRPEHGVETGREIMASSWQTMAAYITGANPGSRAH